MMTSLRARLFIELAVFILATGLTAGGLAFRRAFGEAIEFQDAILLQIGALAVNNRLQTQLLAEGGAEARVVIEELGRSPGGTQPKSPLPRFPADLPDGLQTISRRAEQWRILVRTRADGSRVAIGQPTESRDEIASDSALRTILPLVVLIPCQVLLSGLVIRLSFRPVSELAARLNAKQSDYLGKLPLKGVPKELLPFITSINRLLERIGTLFDQQRRFIADAAHELRSPITALSLHAENLERANLSQEALERLATLKTGIRRTAHLLEQLLALAKYDDAGSEQQAPIMVFDHIVKDVVSELLPFAEARSVDLGFERNESVSIRADATALAVLVRNLIDNALRHTPEGGRIDINLFHEGGRAVLRVKDTGSGIPEADLGRAFEPFYRSRGAEGDGTGLGLSIVHRIADRLAGSIELENIAAQDRSGLRVTVSIPIVG